DAEYGLVFVVGEGVEPVVLGAGWVGQGWVGVVGAAGGGAVVGVAETAGPAQPAGRDLLGVPAVCGFQVVVGAAQVDQVGVAGGATFGVVDGVVDVGAVAGYPAAGEGAAAVADSQEAAQAGGGEPVGRIPVGGAGRGV